MHKKSNIRWFISFNLTERKGTSIQWSVFDVTTSEKSDSSLSAEKKRWYGSRDRSTPKVGGGWCMCARTRIYIFRSSRLNLSTRMRGFVPRTGFHFDVRATGQNTVRLGTLARLSSSKSTSWSSVRLLPRSAFKFLHLFLLVCFLSVATSLTLLAGIEIVGDFVTWTRTLSWHLRSRFK